MLPAQRPALADHSHLDLVEFKERLSTVPDITGARDDGTALASLLTALEDMGLITDSTTAT
jgi:hypothetical protein